MKSVFIPWKQQLEDYYNIAAAGGHTSIEAVADGWFSWARVEYGRYTDLELEAWPEKEEKKFIKYLEGNNE